MVNKMKIKLSKGFDLTNAVENISWLSFFIILSALVYALCAATTGGCGGPSSTNNRRPSNTEPQYSTEFQQIYIQEVNSTVLTTPSIIRRDNDRREGMIISLMASWDGHATRPLPDAIGLVFTTTQRDDIPGRLLLIDFIGTQYVKMDTYKEGNMQVALMPLRALERFISRGPLTALHGYLGSEEDFIEFELSADDCAMFRRFIQDIYKRAR